MIAKLIGMAIPAWVYEVILALALLGGVTLYLEHRGATHELQDLKVSSAKLLASTNKQIQAEVTAHAADVKANQEKLNAALAANTALQSKLDSSVVRFDAYRRAHPDVSRPTGVTGTAVAGECGDRSCGDLASELAVRGNQLAGSLGDTVASLQSCQRDRDSLTGLPR